MNNKLLTNKYSSWYFSIISNAQKRIPVGYCERHHIIPISLNGSNDPSNIVSLTAREHFICHRLLLKITSGKDKSKMVLAFQMMISISKTHNGQRYTKLSSKSYELFRVLASQTISELKKGVPVSEAARLNIKASRTQEVRDKISKAQKGRNFPGDRKKLSESVKLTMTPEHRKHLSEKAKNRAPISEETREKMRASKRPMTQETKDKLTAINKARALAMKLQKSLDVTVN